MVVRFCGFHRWNDLVLGLLRYPDGRRCFTVPSDRVVIGWF